MAAGNDKSAVELAKDCKANILANAGKGGLTPQQEQAVKKCDAIVALLTSPQSKPKAQG